MKTMRLVSLTLSTVSFHVTPSREPVDKRIMDVLDVVLPQVLRKLFRVQGPVRAFPLIALGVLLPDGCQLSAANNNNFNLRRLLICASGY